MLHVLLPVADSHSELQPLCKNFMSTVNSAESVSNLSALLFPRKKTRWWFQMFSSFTTKIGEDETILTSIFFKRVVQPPTRKILVDYTT